jgi:tetratricopeptide (TPR) repeat protein
MENKYVRTYAPIFIDAIEDLKKRKIVEAQNKLRTAASNGIKDAVCALILINIMYNLDGQYNIIISNLAFIKEKINSSNPNDRLSAYGYYLLGRSYACIGLLKSSKINGIINIFRKQKSDNNILIESINYYKMCISKKLDFIDPYLEIAIIYDIGLNDKNGAKEFYSKVLENNPDHYLSRRKIAEVLIEDHLYENAQIELERIVSVHKSPTSYILLSSVSSVQNRNG